MFLNRLKQVSLPKLIYSDAKGAGVTAYHLSYPSRLEKIDDLHNQLENNLADSVLGRRFVAKEEINNVLASHPGLVIIHSHFLTEDWQRYGSKTIENFLRFWQDWPDITTGKCSLIICLFIKYQTTKSWGIKRFCMKIKNKKIVKFIKQLSLSEFSQFDGLIGTVLPELNDITRGETEDWARAKDTKRFFGEEKTENLIIEVREIFEQWKKENSSNSNTIPMEYLAKKLRKILENCSIAQEERE